MKEWLASLPPIPVTTQLLVLLLAVLLGYIGYQAWNLCRKLPRFWRGMDRAKLIDRFGIKKDLVKSLAKILGVAFFILAVLAIIFLIWKVPQWQIAGSELSVEQRLQQENEHRRTMVQIVGGVFLLIGLYVAWVRSKAMRDKAEVDREQQLTNLYVQAIEQLGSENLQIRLGGIYALERIARESSKDHWTVMEVLTAFVRVNAPRIEATPEAGAAMVKNANKENKPRPIEKPQVDIQAVLTVLGRTAIPFAKKGEKRSLDLRITNLTGADLQGAFLQGAHLSGANLQGASLIGANLQGAIFYIADLQGADLMVADLQGAGLRDANLEGADLGVADLQGAVLMGANLQAASLMGANLKGAYLWKANLQGADLRGPEGLNTGVEGLTNEQVAEAYWDETTLWPEGFSPPAPRQLPPKEKKKREKEYISRWARPTRHFPGGSGRPRVRYMVGSAHPTRWSRRPPHHANTGAGRTQGSCLKTDLFCHPERQRRVYVFENTRFFALLRMTFRWINGF